MAASGAALLALGVLVSYAASQPPESLRPTIAARYPDIRWVRTTTLARWLADDDERVILLDTRARGEFRVSHLRGARLVDPDLTDIANLGLPSDAKIVIYCSVGWRSGIMADRFRRAGFRDVYNLEGGIFAWANAGRAVYRGSQRAETVHPYDDVWGRMLNSRYHPED